MIHKLTSLESFFFRGVMRCDEWNPGRMCVIFTLLCLSGGGSRGGIDWKSELSAPIPVKSGRRLTSLHRRKKKGKKDRKIDNPRAVEARHDCYYTSHHQAHYKSAPGAH